MGLSGKCSDLVLCGSDEWGEVNEGYSYGSSGGMGLYGVVWGSDGVVWGSDGGEVGVISC